jgi:hypothetical protein
MIELNLPDELLEQLADRIAERVVALIGDAGSPWMKMEQAIAYTGIPAGTFRKQVASGEIRSHGGKTKVFHRDELDEDLGYAAPAGGIRPPTPLRRAS